MRPELAREVNRLLRLWAGLGAPVTLLTPASAAEIGETQAATGVRFDEYLRALYLLSNGGRRGDTWFAAGTDQLAPFRFLPLAEVREIHGSIGESSFDPEWNNGGVPIDPRIRRYDNHTAWLPFADFGSSNATVYFDADPTELGSYGQIITYQHDPDAIRFLAKDVVDFLRMSNNLVERQGRDLLVDHHRVGRSGASSWQPVVKPPAHIDGARVLEWAWSETPFGEVGDTPIHGLALCQYDGSTEVYRFSCDAAWTCQQDAPHGSLEEAKTALPAQYRRVEAQWRKPE